MGTFTISAGPRRPFRVGRVSVILAATLVAMLGPAALASGEVVIGPNSTWTTKGMNGTQYSVRYLAGCDPCYLNAYITWKGSKGDLGLRVTSPSGEVRDFNTRRASQKFEFAYWPPVLEAGVWKLEAFGSPGTHISLTVGIYDGS